MSDATQLDQPRQPDQADLVGPEETGPVPDQPLHAPRDDARVLGDLAPEQVRVRFPPSPTGNLHVGNVRSALFNWVFARHYGGTFVLRVEDTDAGRNLAESYQVLYDSLTWLGLEWDEGPGVGGPYAPYVQSERGEIYREVARQLLEDGSAYRCYCTREEIETREAARGQGRGAGLRRPLPHPPCRARRAPRGAGRPVGRPDAGARRRHRLRRPRAWRGALRRGARARLRPRPGERRAALHARQPRRRRLHGHHPRAARRGPAAVDPPPDRPVRGVGPDRRRRRAHTRFGHLPTVLGEGNRRLSKRDKGAGLAEYREQGYLPEGLLNYLALLGWSIAEDRDVFTLAEMVEAFDILRVNANPARFDPRKCEAINASHIRLLDVGTLTEALVPYFVTAGLVVDPPTAEQHALLAAVAPLVQERIQTLSEATGLVAFLFVPDADLVVEDGLLTPASAPALTAAHEALAGLETVDAASVEAALRAALVDGLGLKPRLAFGPVRAAVTGRKISPPLFESIELLGRDATLARLAAAQERLAGPDAAR